MAASLRSFQLFLSRFSFSPTEFVEGNTNPSLFSVVLSILSRSACRNDSFLVCWSEDTGFNCSANDPRPPLIFYRASPFCCLLFYTKRDTESRQKGLNDNRVPLPAPSILPLLPVSDNRIISTTCVTKSSNASPFADASTTATLLIHARPTGSGVMSPKRKPSWSAMPVPST